MDVKLELKVLVVHFLYDLVVWLLCTENGSIKTNKVSDVARLLNRAN